MPLHRIMCAVGTAVFLLTAEPAVSQDMAEKGERGTPIAQPHDRLECSPDGIGVGGFDLVSYRQPNGPVPGNAEFSVVYENVSYLFSNANNRDLFLRDPVFYLPQYQGWCAITLALGRLICPDYSNFKVEDSRLLFFEVTGFTNGRLVWDDDPAYYRNQADINFDITKTEQAITCQLTQTVFP